MPEFSTFTLFVFFLVLIGIGKDIYMGARWLEKWLRTRSNGDPKSPANLEVLTALLRSSSAQTSLEIRESIDKHMQALMRENQTTNELLGKFLMAQRIIAKTVHGIDLPV